jgi:hypothetical protein
MNLFDATTEPFSSLGEESYQPPGSVHSISLFNRIHNSGMGGPDGMEAYRPEYAAAVSKLLSCFFSDILTEKYPRFSNKRR